MAFVTQKSGENPLEGVDDGVYEAEIVGFSQVDNRFKGQLFNPNQPEGENNRRNNYDIQYEITLDVDTDGETVQTKTWANPTVGERSKLRKIAKAAGVWEADDEGNEGFDDDEENLVGRKVRVLVEDGRIGNWMKVK